MRAGRVNHPGGGLSLLALACDGSAVFLGSYKCANLFAITNTWRQGNATPLCRQLLHTYCQAWTLKC